MDSSPVLSHLCAVHFRDGDCAYLVSWSNGEFGIVRNGQAVGQQRWGRKDLVDCGRAFLNYVYLTRRRIAGDNRSREVSS